MEQLEIIIRRMILIWKRRFFWLYEKSKEDFEQTVRLSCVESFEKGIKEINRRVCSNLEKLARELGWRRCSENQKRVWMSEFNWLKRGRKFVGAPVGNQNRKKKII